MVTAFAILAMFYFNNIIPRRLVHLLWLISSSKKVLSNSSSYFMLSPSEMLCSAFPERGFLCQQNPLPGNLDPFRKKQLFQGVKPKKNCPNFFLRLRDTYKKYILQKNWVKTAIPALSSGQSNLHRSIWSYHRQLDDQHRNPNMNNKDHHYLH